MLELTPLTFSLLFNDITQMLDEVGNIMCLLHSLLTNSYDVVLAIKVDVAQVKMPQFTAELKQGCSNFDKLTGLNFAE